MDFDKILQIASILFGAGGIISAVVSYRRSNAQNDLDISSAWEKFYAPLSRRIEILEERVINQDIEISDLRGWAERLVRQIIQLGGVPEPFVSRHKKPTEYPGPQE